MRNLLLLLLLVPFSSISFSQHITPKKPVNEEGIPVSSMKNESMDPVMIQNLAYAINKGVYPNIHSLLIARNGKLVYENYFDGFELIESDPPLKHFTKDNMHDLRSITKSITSACIGIAIAQGKIKNVDQKVFDFFPEYSKQDTGLKSAITIKNLLTMSSGLLWNEEVPYTSNENTEIQMDDSGDPLTFILERPMQDTAGKVWNYSGGATQLLGCIIEKATGRKLDEFEDSYMISNLLCTKENKTEEHSFKHYVFTLGEVKRLLKLYGLSTIATYSSTSKEEYNLGDQQVYIVAKKE